MTNSNIIIKKKLKKKNWHSSQPNPMYTSPLLATSGIDDNIKMWGAVREEANPLEEMDEIIEENSSSESATLPLGLGFSSVQMLFALLSRLEQDEQ